MTYPHSIIIENVALLSQMSLAFRPQSLEQKGYLDYVLKFGQVGDRPQSGGMLMLEARLGWRHGNVSKEVWPGKG